MIRTASSSTGRNPGISFFYYLCLSILVDSIISMLQFHLEVFHLLVRAADELVLEQLRDGRKIEAALAAVNGERRHLEGLLHVEPSQHCAAIATLLCLVAVASWTHA